MRVVIHIHQMILHGLPVTPLQLPEVRAGLERELQTLFRGSGAGVHARSGVTPKLVGRSFEYRTETGAYRLGRQAARAVHEATQGSIPR